MKLTTRCLIIAVEKKVGRSITGAKLVSGRWKVFALVNDCFKWVDMSDLLKMGNKLSPDDEQLAHTKTVAKMARIAGCDLMGYSQLVLVK